MKKIVSVVVLIFFSAACSTTYKPVATLEDVTPKDEIEKSRNWIEPNSDSKLAAAAASGFLGGILIGIPLAIALASIPDEKGLTITELADKVSAKTCDKAGKNVYYTNNLSDDLGIIGVTVPDEEDDVLRPVGVMYVAKKDDVKLLYSEVRLVKKIDGNTYWGWRIPLLKKTPDGNLAFILNERLRLDGPITANGGASSLFEFSFIDELAGGARVKKTEMDLLKEVRAYFMGSSFSMETLKCALGDKVCGTNKKASDDTKAEAIAGEVLN